MSPKEIIDKTNKFIESIKQNHNNLRESLLFDEIKQFREFMSYIQDSDRSIVTPLVYEAKLDVLLLEVLKNDSCHSYNFAEEITSIYIGLTSVTNINLICEMTHRGVLPVFENLLNTKNGKILENVLWVLSNIVFDNYLYRNIYEEYDIVSKVTATRNEWVKRNGNDIGITYAYLRFLESYFAVSPSLGYSKMKPYVELLIYMYLRMDKTLTESIERECLQFLNGCLVFSEQEDIDELVSHNFWNDFLLRLVGNLAATDMKIVTFSIKILYLLACSDNALQFKILLKSPFFNFINDLFKDNYHTIERDLVVLIGNIMTFGDEYVDQLIEYNLFYKLLEGFSKTIYNKDAIYEYLLTFRNICRNEYNALLTEYVLNNVDLIDLFMDKIDLKESPANLKLICKILKSIYMLAENHKIQKNEEDNVVRIYIANNEKLAQKLEMVQQHVDEEVYITYAEFVDNYF